MSSKMMVPPGTHISLAALHFEKHSILFRNLASVLKLKSHTTITTKEILRLKTTAFSTPQKEGKCKN
jgi:hypothetical protein